MRQIIDKVKVVERRTLRGRRWYVQLLSDNGEKVLTSEGYNSRQHADAVASELARRMNIVWGE